MKGIWYKARGMFNLGKYVKVEKRIGKDYFKIDLVEKVYHEKSFIYEVN